MGKEKEIFERFGNDLSAEQIALVVAHECECDDCGADLLADFMDFPEVDIEDGYVLCEDCEYNRRHENDVKCDWCEDVFDDPQTPEEKIFTIYPSMESSAGIDTGVYQVLSFPFWYSDMFSQSIFEDSVQRVGDIPDTQEDRERSSPICPCCWNNYISMKTQKTFAANGKKMRILQLPFGKTKTVWF